MPKVGEVCPADSALVLANNRNMKPTPFAMQWGYTMPDGKLLINARSETAAQKRMFSDGMARRRCIIPASCYFEWQRTPQGKQKFAIGPKQQLTYLAGIYRFEGEKPVFTILTREPAEQIAFIHPRMPVILPRDAARQWLDAAVPATHLLQYAVEDVAYTPAGS